MDGYIAFFLWLFPSIFRNVKYLRLVNTIGCITFVVYGYFIESYPVMIANMFIFIMNIYHLKRDNKTEISKAD